MAYSDQDKKKKNQQKYDSSKKGTARRKKYSTSNKGREFWQKRNIFRSYGLTVEEYMALLTKSRGLCAICGSMTSKPCLDHDHQSGAVREFLCRKCNSGLGFFLDDPVLLDAAAMYLRKHDGTS